MHIFKAIFSAVVMAALSACGGGNEAKPDRKAIQTVQLQGSPEDQAEQGLELLKPRRRALLIANGTYQNADWNLDNPENDARLIRRSLSRIGFDTRMRLNQVASDGIDTILDFLGSSRESDLNVVYYAGHAFQINGENYLVPTDFTPTGLLQGDVTGMIRLSEVVRAIEQSGGAKTIVILDACRNNPLEQDGAQNGLALPPPIVPGSTSEIFFLYATAPGQVAKDGADGNSPFSKALSNWIIDKDLTFEKVVQATIRDVSSETLGAQIPWQSSNFSTPVRLAEQRQAVPIVLDDVPLDLAGEGELLLQPDIWSMIDQNADNSRKDSQWKGVDDLRYVAVADDGDRANVLTCQGDGRRCNHGIIAADTVYRCEERGDTDCGLYAVILNGNLMRLWRGDVGRVRGSRTEGLSIAIALQWEKVGAVNGQVDYNAEGLGAIDLLMVDKGVRCAGVYKFTAGSTEGRFNGSCGDGSNFTGTFTRNSTNTFYAKGSDSFGRRFNGLISSFYQ